MGRSIDGFIFFRDHGAGNVKTTLTDPPIFITVIPRYGFSKGKKRTHDGTTTATTAATASGR
jgi:hypothetical protein